MNPSPVRTSLGLLTLLAVGCGLNQVHKPAPPAEAEEARTLLDHPDGRFGDGDPQAVFDSVESALKAFRAVCGYDPSADAECLGDSLCRRCAILAELGDTLQKLSASLQSSPDASGDAGTGPSIPGLKGLLEVDVTCKGFDNASKPDPDNGATHLTVGFTARGFDKVLWGEFDDCATVAADLPVRLNGQFSLDFDTSAVRRAALETTPVVFSFEGSVLDVMLDQLDEGRVIVYQRLDGKGAFAVGVGNDDLGTFVARVTQSVRALAGADGSFTCDTEEGTCELLDD